MMKGSVDTPKIRAVSLQNLYNYQAAFLNKSMGPIYLVHPFFREKFAEFIGLSVFFREKFQISPLNNF